MNPLTHVVGQFGFDSVLLNQHLKHVVFPDLEEQFGGDLRHGMKSTGFAKGSFGDDHVNVGIPQHQRTERLDRGHSVVAIGLFEGEPIHVLNGLSGTAGQLA